MPNQTPTFLLFHPINEIFQLNPNFPLMRPCITNKLMLQSKINTINPPETKLLWFQGFHQCFQQEGNIIIIKIIIFTVSQFAQCPTPVVYTTLNVPVPFEHFINLSLCTKILDKDANLPATFYFPHKLDLGRILNTCTTWYLKLAVNAYKNLKPTNAK